MKASCRSPPITHPTPSSHFFQKRSLDVTTAQILDLIMPEFRRGDLGAAPGGDQGSALGRHLNPFQRKGDKPVVYWSGILDSDSSARELRVHRTGLFQRHTCVSWRSP